jgi:O-antigen ligase
VSSRARSVIGILYLALCVVLGGASAAGAVANAVLQALALVVIVLLLWTKQVRLEGDARPLLWLVALFVVYCAITLVALPPSVWTALPYRDQVAEGLGLIGVRDAWLPISLAPRATVAALLWLLPPAAMFLLVVSLPPDDRRKVSVALIAIALLSTVLGIFQLIGGPSSGLRFYEVTNEGAPVGFFANINHQVTLLLCAFPCAAVIAARFATGHNRSTRGGGLILSIAVSIFLAIGIAASGSLAGYGLSLPAVFAALLIYRRAVAGAIGARWRAALAVLILAFFALAILGPLNQQALSKKFDETPVSRGPIAMNTLGEIAKSMPVGTGLGTFTPVYRRLEDPGKARKQYVNHAHNDYLELALELGVVGVLLILGFLLWWVRRSARIWSSDFQGANLSRAGTVMIGIVLVHSFVDYPLRTSAIACVFAMACAFLVPYSERARRRRGSERRKTEDLRHLEAA